MKDKILKLLKSPVYEDVILGINLLKKYDYKDIRMFTDDTESRSDRVYIVTQIDGNSGSDNYKINDTMYCHFNVALFIYPSDNINRIVKYKEI